MTFECNLLNFKAKIIRTNRYNKWQQNHLEDLSAMTLVSKGMHHTAVVCKVSTLSNKNDHLRQFIHFTNF